MSTEYKNNHYVPVWYQKRFLLPGQRDKELFYLNLRPEVIVDSKGRPHTMNPIRRLGPKHCFVEENLYTARFGSDESTRIERMFFGAIDADGREAVEYFSNFTHPSAKGEFLKNMLLYMSTQKLRTPKGLGWLANTLGTTDRESTLHFMLELQQLHCAVWTECVWLIADASESKTKFIISDHPITVYNRRTGPRSMWCRDYDDPDISLHGTHTIFPLSLDKVLLLTNLSWIRDPYQSEVARRPNPHPWRQTIFNFMDIQTSRHLSEQEVREINFIIKSRSLRFIAAAQKEWLYPDDYISKSNWNTFGSGYLCMPDPRAINLGGEILIRYRDGSATSFDAYGRRPWQLDYDKESKGSKEGRSLYRFKGEFARLFGPCRRGRSYNLGSLDDERDSDDFHEYHLKLERKS